MDKNRLMLLLVVLLVASILVETIGVVFPLYFQNSYLTFQNSYLTKELSAAENKTAQLSSEIESLRSEIEKLNSTVQELNKEAENQTSIFMCTLVVEYANTLNQISYHLTAIWEDSDKEIQVSNYKINGALYHLEYIIWLIKHAYWLVKPYSNDSELFQLLTGIICNNTFGDVIMALQRVYGHIYAYDHPLGTHQIDVDLLAGCANYIPKIYKILSKVELDELPPYQQISDEDYYYLQTYFQGLNRIVKEYLQKPGTEIS